MKYRELEGYKIALTEYEFIDLKGDFPDIPLGCGDYVRLLNNRLEIKIGYAWNGANFPAKDDEISRAASLVHDVLYQLIREGLLPMSYRKAADKELEVSMLKWGDVWFKKPENKDKDTKFNRAWLRARANLYYRMCWIFGANNAKPEKNPRGQEFKI